MTVRDDDETGVEEESSPLFAILDDREVVVVGGRDWMVWMASVKQQTSIIRGVPVNEARVAYDVLYAEGYEQLNKDITISTVFIGINSNFLVGKPMWFETAVFVGDEDEDEIVKSYKTSTWQEAQDAHEEMVRVLIDQLEDGVPQESLTMRVVGERPDQTEEE